MITGSMSSKHYDNYVEYLDFKAGRGPNPPKAGTIDARTAALLKDYLDDYVAERGIKMSTAVVNCSYLISFSQKAGPLDAFTTRDVKRVVGEARRTMKPNSVRKFINNAKHLCAWLHKEGINPNLNLDEIQGIKEPARMMNDKKPSDMLTQDEILAMVDACRCSRDRAIIMTAFEGALRAVEVCRLKWSDLVVDDKGIVFTTKEKTNKVRRVRLWDAVPYINAWKADYPGNPVGNAPVFVNFRGSNTGLSYQALKKVIWTAGSRAGIEKHVHPHLMRHSRVTEMLQQGVSETAVKKMCWGTTTTPMLATYEHMSDDSLDAEILAGKGIETPEKKKAVKKAEQCPDCATICPVNARLCPYCGYAFDPELRKEVAGAKRWMKDNPKIVLPILAEQNPEAMKDMIRGNKEMMKALIREVMTEDGE